LHRRARRSRASQSSLGCSLASGIGWRLSNPRVLAKNLVAAGSEIETPDSDFSFEFLRQHSTVLFLAPRFSWLLLFSLFSALVWGWSVRAESHPASGRATLTIALAGASAIALAFAGPSARMRLPLLLPAFICTGWFLGWLWDALAAREWTRASRALVAVLAVRLVWLAVPPPAALHRNEVRLDDFVVGGFLLAERGDFVAADKELGRAWNLLLSRTPPEDALEVGLKLRKAHMLVFFRHGEMESVREDWDVLRKAIPNDPLVQEVGRVLGTAP
jgi:hypothetical protein